MRKTVLVTAIGSFAAQPVIAGCRRLGFRVVGCDIYPSAWVVNSMEVDAFYQAPYASDREAWKEFLVRICRREQVEFVMPLTDVEVDVLADWQSASGDLDATVCMSEADTVLLCRNKERMAQFLAGRNICRVIRGRRLSELLKTDSVSGLPAVPPDLGMPAGDDPALMQFPLVVKPVDGRSSQGLRVIETPREFSWTAELLEDQADRYLVQEKVPGQVITVDVVRQPDTGTCVCLPRRELVRTPNGAGVSVQVFRDPGLEALCRGVAAAVDIRGCVNFEFIQHEVTGEWHFLECNPRFSGGVAFSIMAGYDMVKNHVNCFTGQELEAPVDTGSQYIARRYMEYRMEEAPGGRAKEAGNGENT